MMDFEKRDNKSDVFSVTFIIEIVTFRSIS